MSGNSSNASNRISKFLSMIVIAVLILSIVSLIFGAYAYLDNQETVALYLFAIGALSMALAIYVLFQSRKTMKKMKIEKPKIMTTVECLKCGTKDVREFKRGDFVYKELDKCDKCEENKIITSIYKEVKEKEKPFTI